MKAEMAQKIAEELVAQLRPFCEQIELAGSLRRRRPEVNDIDLVLMTKPYAGLALRQRLFTLNGALPEKMGEKYMMLANYKGIQVDLYCATGDTWTTLLLIRTGSMTHNIQLCNRARALGLRLKADGQGLMDARGFFQHPKTEQELFEMLGLPYKEPWEREA